MDHLAPNKIVDINDITASYLFELIHTIVDFSSIPESLKNDERARISRVILSGPIVFVSRFSSIYVMLPLIFLFKNVSAKLTLALGNQLESIIDPGFSVAGKSEPSYGNFKKQNKSGQKSSFWLMLHS